VYRNGRRESNRQRERCSKALTGNRLGVKSARVHCDASWKHLRCPRASESIHQRREIPRRRCTPLGCSDRRDHPEVIRKYKYSLGCEQQHIAQRDSRRNHTNCREFWPNNRIKKTPPRPVLRMGEPKLNGQLGPAPGKLTAARCPTPSYRPKKTVPEQICERNIRLLILQSVRLNQPIDIAQPPASYELSCTRARYVILITQTHDWLRYCAPYLLAKNGADQHSSRTRGQRARRPAKSTWSPPGRRAWPDHRSG
jgi:hypothetical protein